MNILLMEAAATLHLIKIFTSDQYINNLLKIIDSNVMTFETNNDIISIRHQLYEFIIMSSLELKCLNLNLCKMLHSK